MADTPKDSGAQAQATATLPAAPDFSALDSAVADYKAATTDKASAWVAYGAAREACAAVPKTDQPAFKAACAAFEKAGEVLQATLARQTESQTEIEVQFRTFARSR